MKVLAPMVRLAELKKNRYRGALRAKTLKTAKSTVKRCGPRFCYFLESPVQGQNPILLFHTHRLTCSGPISFYRFYHYLYTSEFFSI